MNLSIVLPTLRRLDTSRLLAARIGELCGSQLTYEVIVVTPAAVNAPMGENVRVVADQGGGVYAAYSQGLRLAQGEYVWLMGDDDFPLDEIVNVIELIKSGQPDLIVAPVIYSSGFVYKPTRSPFVLLFYNWCQQGVLYRTRALRQHRFFKRLKIQADHYVNILLRSDRSLRIAFLDRPICIFGANGVSSRGGDLLFRKLRPYLAHRTLTRLGFLMFQSVILLADTVKRLKRAVR